MKVKLSLPKAKSRGLTYALMMEAINSDKSWEEIKDLLWLKFYNANIHTDTSCFMDIQQGEKESLAAYLHRFKKEAMRFNFTNDAATIRIFVKGLKNAHSLAMCIYEKGPEMFTDGISEVEKLNSAQQLKATIIPPSTVNIRSHEEYHCFQCQEQGHIAWNCPCIRCYECDKYGHIVMDCLTQDTCFGNSRNLPQPSQESPCQIKFKTPPWSQRHFQRHHSLSHCNLHRNHSRSQHWDGCSDHRNSSQQSYSILREDSHKPHHDTPDQWHHRSSQHRSSSGYWSWHHSRSHSQPSYRSSRHESHQSSSQSSRMRQKQHPKKNIRVKIEDPYGLLQLWWSLQWLRRGIPTFKLTDSLHIVTSMKSTTFKQTSYSGTRHG